MLSLEEAENFAVEVLKVPYSAERVKNDSISLLNELIRAFHATIPFQDLILISKPLKERRIPTIEQVKEDVLSGRGGLCYTLNTFMKYFLEALGYGAHHVASTVVKVGDHIMTRVDIARDKFIVDVGCGYPTFEAIPVNFEKESPFYKHSFVEYKFVRLKEGDGGNVFGRRHRSTKHGNEFKRKTDEDGCWQFYQVDLTPRSLDFFIESAMTTVYTTPGYTPLHDSLRVVVFPVKGGMYGFNDKTQLVENDSGKLDSKELTSDEVIQAVATRFPMLTEAVKTAVANLGLDK